MSRYEYGAASLVSITSWLSRVRRRQMTICAERGVLIFDDRSPQKLSLHEKDGSTSHPRYGNELPLTSELRTFLDVVRSHSTDASQIALGVAIAQAIEGTRSRYLTAVQRLRSECEAVWSTNRTGYSHCRYQRHVNALPCFPRHVGNTKAGTRAAGGGLVQGLKSL